MSKTFSVETKRVVSIRLTSEQIEKIQKLIAKRPEPEPKVTAFIAWLVQRGLEAEGVK